MNFFGVFIGVFSCDVKIYNDFIGFINNCLKNIQLQKMLEYI